MNKRGLTLVELLATITIISLLAIIITPGIMTIRQNVLEHTLQTKISFIENAAKDYAQQNITELKSTVAPPYNGEKTRNENCIYRTVRFLIDSGYITSNNSYMNNNTQQESKIINPVTGQSMNNELICIRFSNNDVMNREIITYIVEG